MARLLLARFQRRCSDSGNYGSPMGSNPIELEDAMAILSGISNKTANTPNSGTLAEQAGKPNKA